jgi:hypothetical protein
MRLVLMEFPPDGLLLYWKIPEPPTQESLHQHQDGHYVIWGFTKHWMLHDMNSSCLAFHYALRQVLYMSPELWARAASPSARSRGRFLKK